LTGSAWKVRKKTKHSLAAADEARLRADAEIAIKQERVRRGLGKKTPADTRGDTPTDEEVFKQIQGAFSTYKTVRFARRFGPGVIYRGTTKDLSKKVSDLILPDDDDDEGITIWVPEWRHTGDKLKTFAWMMVLRQEGSRARTLNVNVGPDVIAMARRARETRGIGFARYLRDRITKRLRMALQPFGLAPPEFFFWVEADRIDRAHLHGVIILPDHPQILRVTRAIRQALKAAAGHWNPAEHERQVKIKGMYDPLGWAGYAAKWRHVTRLRIEDDNTVAASGGLRSRGAAWYREARATGNPINTAAA
jgi:hypothetical protein